MSRLVTIVGPTASGKSELAMRIARKFGGEIICADSRTIYKSMDIGTAKPSRAEQAEIPHHLLDLIEPDQSFSAAEFKTAANQVISQIEDRGHLSILAGGSGLYVYSVIYDYKFPAGPSNALREELQQLSTDQLVERLRSVDPQAAETIDLKNPRRLIRAIETAGTARTQQKLRQGAILVGLRPDDQTFTKTIARRTKFMIEAGLVEETSQLAEKFGSEIESLKSPGYSETVEFLAERISRAKLEELINLHTRQLVKRQLTWFKRNADINWFEDLGSAEDFVAVRLQVQKV